MRIMVTGGAGFIGSSFVRMAVGNGHDVAVVDCLTYAGDMRSLDPVNDKLTFFKADICRGVVGDFVSDFSPDVIVNFAAETHVDRSIKDSYPFVRTNVQGTRRLLDLARGAGIRMVQVSTDEVYGQTDGKPFEETTPLAPRNPYSASKAAADMMALAYYSTYDMDVVVTRCCNNYGPYQYPEKLIPLFVSKLLKGEKVPLYGDGLNVREWLHCADHSAGIMLAIERGKKGEVYHFGGDNPVANLKMTRLILDALGKDDSSIEYVEDRLGHDRMYLMDCSKSKRELGWKPAIPFHEGITSTVSWYRNNDWWFTREASSPRPRP